MNSAPASQAAREACGRWFLANRSVEAAPNDPAALVGRAASFLAMDRPWEATNDLDRALRMQTRLAGADVAAAGDEATANQRRRRHDGEAARTRLLRGHAHAACLRYDRAVADFEYELQMANMNRHLNEEVETVFIMADDAYFYVSSNLIKEAAKLGGDVDALVPKPVAERLRAKLG